MFGFLKRRRRERLRATPFPSAWLEILEKNFPLYRRLSAADQRELQGHIQVFLAEKQFEGCGGLEITDEIKVTIAAQACLLLLHRDTDYYPWVHSVLVYPSAYVGKTASELSSGLWTEGEQPRGGESWRHGPVVLTWDHVRSGAADIADGHNIVFHE